MILKLNYSEIEKTAVKGEVNGKTVNFFLVVNVDETNLVEAIERFRGNRWVVALNYSGNLDALSGVDVGDRLVLVVKQFETLDINVDFTMNSIPPNVTLVVELPKTFHDMRLVKSYADKYPNIRFEGGHFLHLEGIPLGTIMQKDVTVKIPKNRLPLVTEGNASIFKRVSVEEIENLEFYEAKGTVKSAPKVSTKKSAPKESAPKKKKKLSSLLDLSSDALDNF